MRLHLIGVSALVSAMEADAPLLQHPPRHSPLWDAMPDDTMEPDDTADAD